MKRVKIFMVAAALVCGLAIFNTSAYAELGWFTCTVTQVGPAGTENVQFLLTDDGGKFKNKWFRARSERTKEMLAVGLTAMSAGFKLKVYADPAISTPPVQTMYLIQ